MSLYEILAIVASVALLSIVWILFLLYSRACKTIARLESFMDHIELSAASVREAAQEVEIVSKNFREKLDQTEDALSSFKSSGELVLQTVEKAQTAVTPLFTIVENLDEHIKKFIQKLDEHAETEREVEKNNK